MSDPQTSPGAPGASAGSSDEIVSATAGVLAASSRSSPLGTVIALVVAAGLGTGGTAWANSTVGSQVEGLGRELRDAVKELRAASDLLSLRMVELKADVRSALEAAARADKAREDHEGRLRAIEAKAAVLEARISAGGK